tara:strand:- start:189 stop:1499 length:1311 start_codon:yes stop_codon:yes gene_type:complete
MGLLKKVFKGIGKVFKKIGKGIKKAFKAFGKFMGKIGFVGQMAMMFLFPAGIGNMFIKGLGSLGKTLAGVGGASGGLFAKAVQGVGRVLLKARDFAVGAKAGFSSITNGIKEFGKTALSKVGINIEGAATNFFGEGETAFSRTMDGFSETGDIIRGLKDKSFTVSAENGLNIDEFSDQMGITKKDLFKLNPGLEGKLTNGITIPQNTYVNLDLAQGSLLGFDPEKISQINQQAVTDAFVGPPAPEGAAFSLDGPRLEAAQATDPTIPGYVEEAFQSETKEFPTTVDARTGLPLDATKQEVTRGFEAGDQMKVQDGTPSNITIDPAGGSATVTPSRANVFSERFARATRGLRPGEVGLVESVKNWQNLASPFMGSPEDVSFRRPGDIIDVSSGIAQYTPEPLPNFAQSMFGGNMFGSPALMEQLQYYGLYRPDTMRA